MKTLLILPLLLFDGFAFGSPNPAVIDVTTAHSQLRLAVDRDGHLFQIHYGGLLGSNASQRTRLTRELQFYPQFGDGNVLEPALEAAHADGNTSLDLRYVRHTTTEPAPDITLTRIDMKDPVYPFYVTLFVKAYRAEDVLEQWSAIRQQEPGLVTLYRFASSSPRFDAHDYYLTQFHGDWADEGNLVEEHLTPGIKVLDSKLGVRASQYRFPSFLLALDSPAREESGEVYGGSLEWSGSYQLAFEIDWKNRLRALAGMNPIDSQYPLQPGEIFVTPGMLWTWSDRGKGQVSRNFHHWALRYGLRNGGKPRPVLLNNWEATGMNFDQDRIVSLFDGARDLGAELFLLDDGWFGNKFPRTNDTEGLGDWQPNTNRLPHGLEPLVVEAQKRGLRFGIWLEPEMVNPKSELYVNHPEWAIAQPHRAPDLSRHQLVLDLTRPAVRDFSWNVINSTLGSNPGISYLKWDANRYITQPGSSWLKPSEQSCLWIDYVHSLYGIMEKFNANYPNVTAMLCSGGGGRADYGALKYFDCFWPSDNTDPVRRVYIQWGYSHFFPACAMCDHVTHSGHRPVKFTLDVAMSGDLGFDVDLAHSPPEELAAMKAAVALYKSDLREIVDNGDLYRLQSPYEGPRAALEYALPDQSKAVVFVYELAAAAPAGIALRGLDPDGQYLIREVNLPAGEHSAMPEDSQTLTGGALMKSGVHPACTNTCQSAVIEVTRQ